jgi:uncharacterized protein
MKLIAGTVILILTFCNSAVYADDQSHRAAAEEMLRISKADQMIKPLFEHVGRSLEQEFNQMNVPEDKKPLLKKYTEKIFAVMENEMSWDKIKDEYIDIYLRVYTEAEIKEIIVFYKTPAGQKMIDKMPLLIQESMSVSQNRLNTLLPRIQQITEEMANEIKKPQQN